MQVVMHKEAEVDAAALETLTACVGFWNTTEARTLKTDNEWGRRGTPETQELARRLSMEQWLLEMVASDCRVVLERNPDGTVKDSCRFEHYDTGKSGSHVWVHVNGDRALMFTVEKNNSQQGV